MLKNYSLNEDELQNALGSESSSEMEVESDDDVDLIVVSSFFFLTIFRFFLWCLSLLPF